MKNRNKNRRLEAVVFHIRVCCCCCCYALLSTRGHVLLCCSSLSFFLLFCWISNWHSALGTGLSIERVLWSLYHVYSQPWLYLYIMLIKKFQRGNCTRFACDFQFSQAYQINLTWSQLKSTTSQLVFMAKIKTNKTKKSSSCMRF